MLLVSLTAFVASAQELPVAKSDAELRFVVYISRHGVRSPTGKAAQYNVYSNAAWPKWPVEPGYLTPHGFQLMELFGAYDRLQLASEGLFIGKGCEDAKRVTVYADSDQRTRETGKALAKGMFPGCEVATSFLPEGTNDPLFHFLSSNTASLDSARATASVAGRIGGDAAKLTEAYRTQIGVLDGVLATCGTAQVGQQRTSLFDIPATLSTGKGGDHLSEYKGPLSVSATLSENLLLEYAEGMDAANVGWGCVDGAKLRSLLDLHTASVDYLQRTHAIAQAQASNLLEHVRRALEQAATGKPVAGAIARPQDKALMLVGHDTNLENISGLLQLDWIADGRRDDTPPGSALVFELWRNRLTGRDEVRSYYTAQTLEQMREAKPLTLEAPPERTQVFIPGCGRADLACSWQEFSRNLSQSIDANAVLNK